MCKYFINYFKYILIFIFILNNSSKSIPKKEIKQGTAVHLIQVIGFRQLLFKHADRYPPASFAFIFSSSLEAGIPR